MLRLAVPRETHQNGCVASSEAYRVGHLISMQMPSQHWQSRCCICLRTRESAREKA